MAQEQEEGSLNVSMRSPSWGLQGLYASSRWKVCTWAQEAA